MLVLTVCSRLLLVFIMPIGLNNIGWKMYMINGGWDIIIIVLIVRDAPYLTKNNPLTNIARLYTGSKPRARHSKRSMRYLRARNIPTFLTWRK